MSKRSIVEYKFVEHKFKKKKKLDGIAKKEKQLKDRKTSNSRRQINFGPCFFDIFPPEIVKLITSIVCEKGGPFPAYVWRCVSKDTCAAVESWFKCDNNVKRICPTAIYFGGSYFLSAFNRSIRANITCNNDECEVVGTGEHNRIPSSFCRRSVRYVSMFELKKPYMFSHVRRKGRKSELSIRCEGIRLNQSIRRGAMEDMCEEFFVVKIRTSFSCNDGIACCPVHINNTEFFVPVCDPQMQFLQNNDTSVQTDTRFHNVWQTRIDTYDYEKSTKRFDIAESLILGQGCHQLRLSWLIQ